MCEWCEENETEISYSDDIIETINKFNKLLKSHGLELIVDDECHDGYEKRIELKLMVP